MVRKTILVGKKRYYSGKKKGNAPGLFLLFHIKYHEQKGEGIDLLNFLYR